MDKNLKQLDDEIAEYIGDERKADEAVFNYGVKLGRYLEKNKIDDIRLDFFVKQAMTVDFTNAINEQTERIGKILHRLVVAAFKKEIELSRFKQWEIDTSPLSFRAHKLSDDVVEKYKIQVYRVEQQSNGSDFDITFSLEGALKEILNAAGINTLFNVDFANNGGESKEYVCEDNLENISTPNIYSNVTRDEDGLKKLAEGFNALSKETLLMMLKYA
ncbi:hypothetical protein G6659_02175 [Polynucleobacter paneuropaeus]|nr:hypothetical protein G6659_02175 [Polynucleobacter paneuropaeus]